MPRKKEAPLSAAEQRKRFEELARETGASTSKKEMRDVIERVAKSDRAARKGARPR